MPILLAKPYRGKVCTSSCIIANWCFESASRGMTQPRPHHKRKLWSVIEAAKAAMPASSMSSGAKVINTIHANTA